MTSAPRPADAGPAEELAGLVERVTFHSEDSGFTVLKVKARGHRDLATVVATAAEISPGEWIEARGRWRMDPKHGRQFAAAEVVVRPPDSLEGIERYLGSGLIRGIGPVYARKLVAAFGKDVFDVIEKRSALLLEVEGIGRQRREAIRAAWQEQKSVREIMTFLFSHGVSTARAFRIYKAYGAEAIARIRLDPYCLARDIRGIGFLTADRIAERLGIRRDSELRARAAVDYQLLQLTDEGHCAYPLGELVARTAGALDIPENIVQDAVRYGVSERRLVQRAGPNGEPLIYLAHLDYAESDLARRFARLARGEGPLASVDAERALPWVEKRIGLELAPEQREAVRQALRAKALVITGGPGVGKTTLVRAILAIFSAKKMRMVLCAPTGRAAKRLSESTGQPAKTIHRLLVFDAQTGEFRHNERHPLAGDVFVVDESSMLDLPLAHDLIRAIPPEAELILVGDVDQLPSVGPGCVLRDLIESGVAPVVRLNRIFRQAAESRIVVGAHRINEGVLPEFPEAGADGDFFFVNGEDPAAAVRTVVRLVRQAIPRRFGFDPAEDIQVLSPMQRGELGARNLNAVLQEALNPQGPAVERFGLRYRRGDKVMQLQNDYDKDVFNGDIGRIAAVNEEDRQVHVRFEGRIVRYDFQELDELAPAYAITIHKSQGSEYPCVVVPIHTQHYVMLQRNLLYTAVTRGRRLVVLVGSKRALAIAVGRAESHARHTTLRERLREAAG